MTCIKIWKRDSNLAKRHVDIVAELTQWSELLMNFIQTSFSLTRVFLALIHDNLHAKKKKKKGSMQGLLC